jgi:hypothetical protein
MDWDGGVEGENTPPCTATICYHEEDTVLEALLGGLIGSILTGLGSFAYSEAQRHRDRNGIRAQIIFLLRQLQTHMAMNRDYPRYYLFDARPLVTRLVELSLTPLSASGLLARERDAIFLAASQSDQETTFLHKDRVRALERGDEEYVRAAGDRAFGALQAAREILHDTGCLSRPSDPRALHNWHAGEPIPGSNVP